MKRLLPLCLLFVCSLGADVDASRFAPVLDATPPAPFGFIYGCRCSMVFVIGSPEYTSADVLGFHLVAQPVDACYPPERFSGSCPDQWVKVYDVYHVFLFGGIGLLDLRNLDQPFFPTIAYQYN